MMQKIRGIRIRTRFGCGRIKQVYTADKFAFVILDKGVEFEIDYGIGIKMQYDSDGVYPIKVQFDDILSLEDVDNERR